MIKCVLTFKLLTLSIVFDAFFIDCYGKICLKLS